MALMDLVRSPKAAEPEVKPEPKVTGRLWIGNLRSYEWDKDDPASVHAARQQFYMSLSMGMAAFQQMEVDSWYGKRTEEVQVRDFDPEAESIRMTAAFAGG